MLLMLCMTCWLLSSADKIEKHFNFFSEKTVPVGNVVNFFSEKTVPVGNVVNFFHDIANHRGIYRICEYVNM
jgi:hypothetical protein